MDPTLKDKMEALEEKGMEYQKQAKYKEALDVYEELLDINRNTYGLHSQEFQKTSIRLCELCNLISMILLNKEKFQVSLLFLKKAQGFCMKIPKQMAVTFNNFACHYRKTGKNRTALMYLQEALKLEWKSDKCDTLADTYLNLCAVLSQLGKHSQALENVLFSITLLQEELLGIESPNLERIPVLAIAYHNMAVELEYLKRFEESIATYDKAAKFARKHLGEEHSLTQNLENVYKNAMEGKEINEKKGTRRRNMENERVDTMKKTYKEQRPHTGAKGVKRGYA